MIDTPIVTLTRELAELFGDGWTADPSGTNDRCCNLDGPDANMFLYDQRGEGKRIEIHTTVPPTVPAHMADGARRAVKWHKISVDATRSAEAIQRDIELRLLADAREAHAAALSYLAERTTARAARHAVRDQLLPLLGPEPLATGEAEDATSTTIVAYTLGKTTGARGEWWLNDDGSSLNLELHGLSSEQARQVAVLLYRKTK